MKPVHKWLFNIQLYSHLVLLEVVEAYTEAYKEHDAVLFHCVKADGATD